MEPFKDEKGINYTGINYQREYLKKVADICKKAFEKGVNKNEILKKELRIPSTRADNAEHKPEHFICKGCKSNARREKRICRCMYYYNQDKYPRLCDSDDCKIPLRWKNTGTIKVKEYEWPTEYVMKHIGGIDLILEDGEGTKYGVEVKPYYSKETISRMFAEILSYTIDTDYKPAIAVFRDSEQRKMIDYFRKENNPDLKEIEEHVKVFTITYEEKGNIATFSIE